MESCTLFTGTFWVGENSFKKNHDPNIENNKRRKHSGVITYFFLNTLLAWAVNSKHKSIIQVVPLLCPPSNILSDAVLLSSTLIQSSQWDNLYCLLNSQLIVDIHAYWTRSLYTKRGNIFVDHREEVQVWLRPDLRPSYTHTASTEKLVLKWRHCLFSQLWCRSSHTFVLGPTPKQKAELICCLRATVWLVRNPERLC